MKIVLYSDKKYEYQISNVISSLDYAGCEDIEILYYTIGFRSDIKRKGLHKIRIPYRTDLSRFEFYKVGLSLDAVNSSDDKFIYMDSDILVSKRFNKFDLKFEKEHPMVCKGSIEYPCSWNILENGEKIFNTERKLMNYLGVKDRSMEYVMSCFYTFDKSSIDFLEEWQSIIENKYFQKDINGYFPFSDETALNVLLWKRRFQESYNRNFVNTHKFSTFKYIEGSDNIINESINNDIINELGQIVTYEQCDNSSEIFFYHGMKDKEENSKILEYMKNEMKK